MTQNTVKINGICSDLESLTGVKFKFIYPHKKSNLPLCSEKKFCKVKNFKNQRTLCRDIEDRTISKFRNTKFFEIKAFKCGLSEFAMPVFNNGGLQGIVLSSKIREKSKSHKNCPNFKKDSKIPCLYSKQVASMASILNYQRTQIAESINLHRNVFPRTKDHILINKAKKFIERNYHNSKLPLKAIASELSTNNFNLCHIFKRELNMTFVQYLTLIRMRAAIKLLSNLNLSVAQISYAVGFSDSHYFDRVFKKFFSCRPKDYRSGSIAKKRSMRQKIASLLITV